MGFADPVEEVLLGVIASDICVYRYTQRYNHTHTQILHIQALTHTHTEREL